MPLKTILFVALFGAACVGSFFSPIWGVLGYVGHYCVGPERQWWHAPISFLGIRYSFILAALTALGIALNWQEMRFGRSLLHKHELLLLGFLGAVWLAALLGQQTVGRYTSAVDHPSVKFTKVMVFTLMLTHVVTTRRNLDKLLWTLVLGSMILGMQAWSKPYRAFQGGRLEGVGGPDFSEANFFGAFMVTVLWIIGVQFLRANWQGKLLCFLAGGFTANAVVLTRSRSAMVGLVAGGLMAILSAPKRVRALVLIGILIAGSGFLYLTDEQFLHRVNTIVAPHNERDSSAQSRIELAKAGLKMWLDHPLGVGPGNFYQNIGSYIPEYAGKDAHNTYIRCLTETGILGFTIFCLILGTAFWLTYQTTSHAHVLPAHEEYDIRVLAFGTRCALASTLACCLTISLTYVEFIWWFLMLPVCLDRVVNNMIEQREVKSLKSP